MPDWKMHLHSGELVRNKVKLENIEDFKFGLIIPDTPWVPGEEACQDGTLKCKMHYYIPHDDNSSDMPNYFKMLKEWRELIANTDFAKGWLLHLILDAVVNEQYNQFIIEPTPGEFKLACYNGDIIEISGAKNKIEKKYKDIHAYEDSFEVQILYDQYMSDVVRDYVYSAGCRIPLVDIVIKINNRLDKHYYTRNVLFTLGQYENMVKDAVEIFLNIAKAEGWNTE